MTDGQSFGEVRRLQWFADKEVKRSAALKALKAETDPKKRRTLRARVHRYKAMITMGPERTSEASRKSASKAKRRWKLRHSYYWRENRHRYQQLTPIPHARKA